jgi:hypothetical protein
MRWAWNQLWFECQPSCPSYMPHTAHKVHCRFGFEDCWIPTAFEIFSIQALHIAHHSSTGLHIAKIISPASLPWSFKADSYLRPSQRHCKAECYLCQDDWKADYCFRLWSWHFKPMIFALSYTSLIFRMPVGDLSCFWLLLCLWEVTSVGTVQS